MVEKRAFISFLIVKGSFITAIYLLRNFIILNFNITFYIFNKLIRFYNYHHMLENNYVYTRDSTVLILRYSKVDLKLTYHSKKALLYLKNVTFY